MENWSKTALWLGVAGIGGFFAYKAYKAYQKGAEKRDAEKLLEDAVKNVDASNTTITKSEAQSIAARLFTAMEGMGTDDATIKDLIVSKKLTSGDIKLITLAFGVKPYGTFGTQWWGDGEMLDLPGWLKKELSGGLYRTVKTKFDQAGIIM